MGKFWDTIKASVADFVDAIPEGDYISTLYFEAAAGDLLMPREITSANRQSVKEAILGLGKPRGGFTDLGLGVDRTLDELNRPNSNRLQFVFFFTDFKHDPPSGSKWRSKDCSAAAWKELREKKARLVDGQPRVVKVFALKLPLDKDVGRDLGLFQCVFGDVEQLVVDDGASLRKWFGLKKAEIERDKLRIQIENEMKKGLSVSIGGAQGDAPRKKVKEGLPLIITSRAEYVDIEVTGVSVTGADERGELAIAPVSIQPFTLAPGEHKEIKVDLQARTGLVARLEKCDEYQVRADVNVTTTYQPAGEISVLMEAGRFYPNTFGATIIDCRGIPWWWLVLFLAGLTGMGVGVHRKWIRPEILTGTVVIRKGAAAENHEVFDRSSFLVGNTKSCAFNSDKFGREKLIEIEFVGRKPKFFRRKPRRGAYVRAVKGAGKMQVERLDQSTNEYKREWVGIPMELSKSDEPINTGTIIKAGDCTVEWQ